MVCRNGETQKHGAAGFQSMKVALHVHTSKYSGCAIADPYRMVEEYANCGFGALFLTEHDIIWPAGELAELQESFPDITIYPGLEMTFYQSDSLIHLLVLGVSDPDYLYIATPGALLQRASDDGLLTVLAHPYRYEGSDEILHRGIYPDALEYRSNTHLGSQTDKARESASRYSIRLVNGDDAHRCEDVGHFWIETDKPFQSPHELRSVVLEGAYGCENLG